MRSALANNASGSSCSLWQTPTVADVTGGRPHRSGARSAELLLNGQVRVLCHRLGLTTSMGGGHGSPDGLTTSPAFVEALMLWPTGWTAGVCSATELSRFRQLMRCALWQLGSPPEAPPAQADLFA